ncbi:MAG: glycosyltransferase family 2 protein [Methanobacterium sp.]
MLPSVSIIVLNWNGWEDTIECLESLYKIDYDNFNILIIDNNSEDDSIKKIKDYCNGTLNISSNETVVKPIQVLEFNNNESKPVNTVSGLFSDLPSNRKLIIIKNNKNYGYAGGNNVGIIYSFNLFNPNYIMILNNDTIVNKDFLMELVNFADINEGIGVIGPKIYYYNNSNIINSAGGVIKWRLGIGVNIGIGENDTGQFNEVNYVDCLLGACILIKSNVIEKIGLLDEKFFLLLEETDFCYRAKIAGFKICYYPKSIIYHKEGFSGKINPLILYYMHRNKLLFFRKHQTFIKICLFTFYVSLTTIINLLKYMVKGDFKSIKCILKGNWDGLTD